MICGVCVDEQAASAVAFFEVDDVPLTLCGVWTDELAVPSAATFEVDDASPVV